MLDFIEKNCAVVEDFEILARERFGKSGAAAEGTARTIEQPTRESQATQLIKLARECCKFSHDGDDAHAAIEISGHREVHNLKSRSFRRYLAQQFFSASETAANGEALSTAINTLGGIAQFKSETRPVFARVGGLDGRIFLDLCNGTWQQIEIDQSGWQCIESKNSPVLFRRASGMLPLPEPARNGSIEELRTFLNLGSEDTFKLIAGWLVGALRPHGPFPGTAFIGEQGSGKSTAERVMRRLIDPNVAPVRSEAREPRDLMIAARNGWVIALDNLSNLRDWLSDALCRLATGGGFGVRELYSDQDEVLFDAQRPVLLNSIEEILLRGDLLDRAILHALPRIADAKRETEATFWSRFEAAQPRILGSLLDGVSCALRRLDSVRLPYLPRMADFVVWVEAAAPAFGWKEGDFLEAYRRNYDAANDLPLQTLVADALQRLALGLAPPANCWNS